MRGRWTILVVLFLVRATMAFQFQSVAALAPLLTRELGVDLADIGVLIGLYLAPGMLLALPGGVTAQKFGDKRIVLAGLALMVAGGLTLAYSDSWSGQVAGRLVAGVGGVLVNVLLTKMATDWFAGSEIATAMAIFLNAWPVGIATSLLVLPPIGAAFGVEAAFLAVALLIIAATTLFTALYEPPANAVTGITTRARPVGKTLAAILAAGAIWSLYNIGFTMIFSFGPSMLVERGSAITVAGSITSLVLWLAAVSVPFGGFLADRLKHHDTFLAASCVGFAIVLVLVARTAAVTPGFIALGIMCGLPAGVIMSLPARVLRPETRAIGMGVFYTVYFFGMMAGTALGGSYAALMGTAGAAFDFGAAMLLLCPAILWLFHRCAKAMPTAARSSA